VASIPDTAVRTLRAAVKAMAVGVEVLVVTEVVLLMFLG